MFNSEMLQLILQFITGLYLAYLPIQLFTHYDEIKVGWVAVKSDFKVIPTIRLVSYALTAVIASTFAIFSVTL